MATADELGGGVGDGAGGGMELTPPPPPPQAAERQRNGGRNAKSTKATLESEHLTLLQTDGGRLRSLSLFMG